MQVTFSSSISAKKGNFVYLLSNKLTLADSLKKIDTELKNAITKALKIKDFKGKEGEILNLLAPAGSNYDNITIVGIGDIKKLNDLSLQKIGGKLSSFLLSNQILQSSLIIDQNDQNIVANIAYGISLKSYIFDKYKKKKKDNDIKPIEKVNIQCKNTKEVEKLYKEYKAVIEGVFLARDVVSEPANILYPDSYAKIIKKELTKLGVTVKILNEKQMAKLNMGALLGVGQGSAKESKLVIMEYNGAKSKKDAPVAFVGKGVTFDTGGISLKPSLGMGDMKYDMGGSAAVVGAMAAIAGRKAKVNAVGIVGLVENMPGDNAQRPGDVVDTMSGQTIEVLNTDAEGRLVLADALWYCQEIYKPKFVINLATLTGAIIIALGQEFSGLFSNCDKLSEKIIASGKNTAEDTWRFPLNDNYDKLIDSPIADIQNISSGKGAGSITAAQFLLRFIKKDVSWAHLDIAGVAWANENKDLCPKGATGYGVRLLNDLVKNYYE